MKGNRAAFARPLRFFVGFASVKGVHVTVLTPRTVSALEPSEEEGLRELLAHAMSQRWAQERLYRDWVNFVGHVARAAGVAPAELEDVVHDTFITVFASLGQLESPGAFRGWLARVTVRQVGRHRRWRRWLSVFTHPGDEARAWESLLAAGASPDVVAEVRQVGQFLERQSERDRLAWVLHRWQGLSLSETAVASGASVATVKRRVADLDEKLERWRHAEGAPELSP